jgi:hypothetical protein
MKKILIYIPAVTTLISLLVAQTAPNTSVRQFPPQSTAIKGVLVPVPREIFDTLDKFAHSTGAQCNVRNSHSRGRTAINHWGYAVGLRPPQRRLLCFRYDSSDGAARRVQVSFRKLSNISTDFQSPDAKSDFVSDVTAGHSAQPASASTGMVCVFTNRPNCYER